MAATLLVGIPTSLEFDFYKIDDWENPSDSGTDCFYAFVGEDKLDFGYFGLQNNEHWNHGLTPCGITWFIQAQGYPTDIGFNSGKKQYRDQIHHVMASIPASCGLYNDGSLDLAFQVLTDKDLADESGGFDNLKIVTYRPADCTDRGPGFLTILPTAPPPMALPTQSAIIIMPSPTSSPMALPTVTPMPKLCVNAMVDFDIDADGNPIAPGEYVEFEWVKYGIVLSASGGLRDHPRLFDMAHPQHNEVGGDSSNRC